MSEGQASVSVGVAREDGGGARLLAEPIGSPAFVGVAAAVREELPTGVESADRPATPGRSDRRRSPLEGREERILRPAVGEGRRPVAEAAGPTRPSVAPTLAVQTEPAHLLARLDHGPGRPPSRRLHIGTVHVTVVRPAAPPARPPAAAPPPAPEPPSQSTVWEAPRYQDPWESAHRWVD